MGFDLITRADDAGSSHAANRAIYQATQNDFLQNVSLMAPAPYIEEAYYMLKDQKHICFGMHATLNSEWDIFKWTPCSPKEKISTLLDDTGNYYNTPRKFKDAPPNISQIITEYNAQLDRLTKLGFNVSYVDSHMFAECINPEHLQAFNEWVQKKGLLNHHDYNLKIPFTDSSLTQIDNLKLYSDTVADAQYLMIFHPACPTEEMLSFYHEGAPASMIRHDRGDEYEFLTSNIASAVIKKYDINVIRYDMAKKIK